MNGNGSEQMPGEAAAKATAALHFFPWIKGSCHKITDLSEQERGQDLCRGQTCLGCNWSDFIVGLANKKKKKKSARNVVVKRSHGPKMPIKSRARATKHD